MFGKRIELFKLFGFSVKIDMSWLIIAFLVTWSLATVFFPNSYPKTEYPELGRAAYWGMGAAAMLGLFVSIVLHELGHSLVARRNGMPMKGITLFIFGGVAEMDSEPPSAKAEFLMAIAGPAVSVLIAVGCFTLYLAGEGLGWPTVATGVLWYLGLINALLVAFNLVPAFPLDGGRVFRSALWQFKGDLKWATRISSNVGSLFGLFMIVIGGLSLLLGEFVGGLWWALLGLFLRGAARSSYQQLLIRRALEGEPVRRFMNTEVRTVSPDISLEDLVEDYIYKYHFKMFPVTENGHLDGCVSTRQVREVPRNEWGRHAVREITDPCTEDNTISPDADAMQALSRMNRNHISRLMVVEGGQLRGIVSMRDMLTFMSRKIELEED